VSVLVVGVASHLLLGVRWEVALLVGAILTSTDAAAVFSVLRNAQPRRRLSGILEAESGFNDAPVVLLVVALSTGLSPSAQAAPSPWVLMAEIAGELAGGAVVGLGIGMIAAWAMRYLGSSASGLFPIGVIAWIVLSYGVASLVHSSGFLAVYLSALVLGNVRLPHRMTTRGFAQALGWFAQIGLFVMLGLLASPSELLGQLGPAVALGLVLLLVARPLSVAASTVWFGLDWREMAFLSWAGLRGAVPIVLATVPVTHGVADIRWVFNLVFVLVFVFTVVQGPTLPLIGKLLGVTDPEQTRNIDIEATPLEDVGADLLTITVGDGSGLHGIEIVELRLPTGSDVSLIVRDDTAFVPALDTTLRHRDELLLVVPTHLRDTVDARLHAVDEHGLLAGWGPAEGKSIRGRRPVPRRDHGVTA